MLYFSSKGVPDNAGPVPEVGDIISGVPASTLQVTNAWATAEVLKVSEKKILIRLHRINRDHPLGLRAYKYKDVRWWVDPKLFILTHRPTASTTSRTTKRLRWKDVIRDAIQTIKYPTQVYTDYQVRRWEGVCSGWAAVQVDLNTKPHLPSRGFSIRLIEN